MKRTTAAAYLDISPGKLDGLNLPRRRCGQAWLYDRRHLDAYVDSLPTDRADIAPDMHDTGADTWAATAAADAAFPAR